MGWRAFRWGGENVWLKTAFPGTAGTIGKGGVNVWSKERGGGKHTKFLVSKNQKNGPIQNPEESSTIACTELCFAPGWLW